MAKQKETKQSTIQRLFVYAEKYKYLTIASWILATISAFVALVPFYFIWRIIKEVLRVAPNYAEVITPVEHLENGKKESEEFFTEKLQTEIIEGKSVNTLK